MSLGRLHNNDPWETTASPARKASFSPRSSQQERLPRCRNIARSLGYSRQAIQRIVDRLTELDYVDSREIPDHARACLLVLTDHGRELYEGAKERREKWSASLMRNISRDQLAVAADTIRQIRLTIEEEIRAGSSSGLDWLIVEE
ncbi:MarR family transcriptional regulator [Sphingobium sp. SCG-1]|uniref:MarR family winged helix-turn-helix transcriptional regulator n=1 Tax=Sphingobium sp. SCG-1 TaxID=2072936 RepID=UPI0011AB6EC0